MTNEKKPQPDSARKPQQVIATFGALLALVGTKCDLFVANLDAGDVKPLDVAMLRGAFSILEAGMRDAYNALDSIDGGGS